LSTHFPYSADDILTNIALGDEKAFAGLLYDYSDHLGTFVYKILGSREAAQEIVQDVFIKVWERRESLSGISDIGNYLFVLTRNLTYNHIRDQSRASARFKQWADEMDIYENANATKDPEDHLELYLPVINAAISALPEQQRRVFELAKREGMSYSQIAEEMQLSAETVKKYMKLALKSVRENVRIATPPSLLVAICLQQYFSL